MRLVDRLPLTAESIVFEEAVDMDKVIDSSSIDSTLSDERPRVLHCTKILSTYVHSVDRFQKAILGAAGSG
jgi:hypothetical protein